MELFTAGQHLSQEALRALLAGELDAEQALQVADHVASCAICAQRLAEAAQTPAHMRAAPRGINEQIRFRLLTSARIRRREFCGIALARSRAWRRLSP